MVIEDGVLFERHNYVTQQKSCASLAKTSVVFSHISASSTPTIASSFTESNAQSVIQIVGGGGDGGGDGGGECVICRDQRSEMISNARNHVCMCPPCSNRLMASNSLKLCPLCREPLDIVNLRCFSKLKA